MEIKIGKTARTCCISGNEFQHEEKIYSLVRIVEGKLEREDYSSEAWQPDYAKGAFSTWTLNYYDPKVAEGEPEEAFSPLRQLFYEAVESEDRVELAKAYLAAQLLRRQKVFRQIKESDDTEGEYKCILYSDRIGNRLIEVRDPSFTYREMESGQKALIQRLQQLETPPEEEQEAEEEPIQEEIVENSIEEENPPSTDEPNQPDDDDDADDDADDDEPGKKDQSDQSDQSDSSLLAEASAEEGEKMELDEAEENL